MIAIFSLGSPMSALTGLSEDQDAPVDVVAGPSGRESGARVTGHNLHMGTAAVAPSRVSSSFRASECLVGHDQNPRHGFIMLAYDRSRKGPGVPGWQGGGDRLRRWPTLTTTSAAHVRDTVRCADRTLLGGVAQVRWRYGSDCGGDWADR